MDTDQPASDAAYAAAYRADQAHSGLRRATNLRNARAAERAALVAEQSGEPNGQHAAYMARSAAKFARSQGGT